MKKNHSAQLLKNVVAANLKNLCEKRGLNPFLLGGEMEKKGEKIGRNLKITYSILVKIFDCETTYEVTVSDIEKLAFFFNKKPACFFSPIRQKRN
ncbi:MAG: hypothetical protein WCX27_00180 [Candidatus Paceibacterota bacterium]